MLLASRKPVELRRVLSRRLPRGETAAHDVLNRATERWNVDVRRAGKQVVLERARTAGNVRQRRSSRNPWLRSERMPALVGER